MKYQSMPIRLVTTLALYFSLALTACKKEIVEVPLDAFLNMQPIVVHQQGVYIVQFSLTKYPYKEVRIKLSTQKSSLHQNLDVKTLSVSPAGEDMFHVAINQLTADTVYHYQIFVKDSASEKEVYSDVYSFKTNP